MSVEPKVVDPELQFVGQKKYGETTTFIKVQIKGAKQVVRRVVKGEPEIMDFQTFDEKWITLAQLKEMLQ